MRRLVFASLAALFLTAPTLAAEPPGPAAVVEALEEACGLYVRNDDYDGYKARAEALGITDFFGTLVRRAPGVDIFAVGATADAPFARSCTIALDGPAALADPTRPAVEAWAKAHGFKPDGGKAKVDDGGRPYTEAVWKAPRAQLQINVFGPGSDGRSNVTVTWSAGD